MGESASITELEPFQKAFSRVIELVKELRADGHKIERLDLGGGLGIPYTGDVPPPTPAEAVDPTGQLPDPYLAPPAGTPPRC